MKKLVLSAIVVASLFSCKKDSCKELSGLLTTATNAGVEHVKDLEDVSKCKAYKKALKDYIDAAEDCSGTSFATQKALYDGLDCE